MVHPEPLVRRFADAVLHEAVDAEHRIVDRDFLVRIPDRPEGLVDRHLVARRSHAQRRHGLQRDVVFHGKSRRPGRRHGVVAEEGDGHALIELLIIHQRY